MDTVVEIREARHFLLMPGVVDLVRIAGPDRTVVPALILMARSAVVAAVAAEPIILVGLDTVARGRCMAVVVVVVA